jgi:Flp pilus assembly protein TadG
MSAYFPTLDMPVRRCPIPSSNWTFGGLWSQSGQSLYEVALLAPLLLGLLVGVIELGRFAYLGILVGNAARAGAGFGAQSVAQANDPGGVQTAAKNDFQNNGQDPSKLTVQAGTFTPSYFGCTCDNNGTMQPDPYADPAGAAALCTSAAGTCLSVAQGGNGGHWVVLVSVEVKEQFSSLFNFIPALSSITIDKTCTLRVTQ